MNKEKEKEGKSTEFWELYELFKKLVYRVEGRTERQIIEIKTTDYDWFIYSIFRLVCVITKMYEFLSPAQIRWVEEYIENKVREKCMRIFLDSLFESLKGRKS